MKKILRRILIVILVLFLLLIVLPVIYWNHKMNTFRKSYSESKVSMTEQTVVTEVQSEDQLELHTQVQSEPQTESRIGAPNLDNKKSEEELAVLHEEYQQYLAPADDEYDYLYASDFEHYELVKLIKARDTKGYGQVLGIEKKITVSDMEEVLKTNHNIDTEYKDFILQYVKDWLALYPESDFRVLYHNLKTLVIDVVSEEEMMMATVSTDSAACYLRRENRILLLEGEDFSRETDNYIILTHELTHCARNANYETADGYKRWISYFENYRLGTYAEEGIITNIAYELQGLGKRAKFYPYQSSCYRIIMDCTGYDAEDFMNHGVNYLIDRMDDYMGDDQYAYYIVALIESISSQKYKSYQDVDFTDYQDLHDYITRMYMKKYLSADMAEEETEQVYRDFCDNIMFYFEDMKQKYDIDEEDFRPAFEQCRQELGK